jgi:hypothetical protein
MSWTYNGRLGPQQAAHNKYCGYVVHGSYNPSTDYSYITYADQFDFATVIRGKAGTTTILFAGSFTAAGCTNRVTCGI